MATLSATCISSIFEADVPCTLTDEHAACSYGQPVVLVDDIPHGPAEVPSLRIVREPTPEYSAWMDADVASADSGMERPAPYRGEKWQYTHDTLDLIERARVAGYRIAAS